MSYAIAAYLLVGVALGAYALQLVRERRRLERAFGEFGEIVVDKRPPPAV